MSTKTIYGNLGFNSDGNLYAISGSGDFKPTFDNTGLYTVQFDTAFNDTPTVTLTQIYCGKTNSDVLNDFTYGGGNTRDNAVMIAVDQNHCRFCVGDDSGDKKNRTVGFIAVGPVDDDDEVDVIEVL